MAQTDDGRKFIRIPGYVRKVNGRPQPVRPHVQSTRCNPKKKK